MGKLLALIILAFLVAYGIAVAQTAVPTVPGFLSTTTTGSAACPPNSKLPCFVPYSITNPLPTVTTGH